MPLVGGTNRHIEVKKSSSRPEKFRVNKPVIPMIPDQPQNMDIMARLDYGNRRGHISYNQSTLLRLNEEREQIRADQERQTCIQLVEEVSSFFLPDAEALTINILRG